MTFVANSLGSDDDDARDRTMRSREEKRTIDHRKTLTVHAHE